ncbi:MAG: hypothetical protein D6798_17920 [Deltaproteobacteria bacterium]|nr:MAG: hypothetical protein D6798_17920 [Deltaproteobacteria bacterium]
MALFLVLPTAGCELAEPRDVTGNFEVTYENNLRVYINDELVAEVSEGEDATIEYNGETFQVSAICSDEGTRCPDETWWSSAAVDQPWGPEYTLLNFVNLDPDHGTLGQRMGGLLEDDGSFAMLSGLSLSGNGHCATIGVGTVTGRFNDDATEIVDGIVTYAWAGGCTVDGVEIGASLRLESDFTAVRTGDTDISGIEAEPPIDEDGSPVDPEEPEPGYATASLRFGG